MPCIQPRHLFGIAVEHQRRAAAQLADAALGGLRPARVVDLGVDVGVEAVFVRGDRAPQGGGLFGDQLDLDDRLDAT